MIHTEDLYTTFRDVQVENRLLLYDCLTTEIAKIENMERVAAAVKEKLEAVVAVWDRSNPENKNG